MPGSGGDERTEPRPSPRNKRAEIVAVATKFFGENGYEDTKWADVATAVGLGPTALYHYFESKQQCLFEILVEAIEDALTEFSELTVGEFGEGFAGALLGDLQARRPRSLPRPGAGRRAGPGPPSSRGAARGGGAPARLCFGEGVRGDLARLPRRRDGCRGDPACRPGSPRPRRDRHPQQRLARVLAGRQAQPSRRWPPSTCRACLASPGCMGSLAACSTTSASR